LPGSSRRLSSRPIERDYKVKFRAPPALNLWRLSAPLISFSHFADGVASYAALRVIPESSATSFIPPCCR
jgi:hypothetical protein